MITPSIPEIVLELNKEYERRFAIIEKINELRILCNEKPFVIYKFPVKCENTLKYILEIIDKIDLINLDINNYFSYFDVLINKHNECMDAYNKIK